MKNAQIAQSAFQESLSYIVLFMASKKCEAKKDAFCSPPTYVSRRASQAWTITVCQQGEPGLVSLAVAGWERTAGPLQGSDLKRSSFVSRWEGEVSRSVTPHPWGQPASRRDPVQQRWQSTQVALRCCMQTIAWISLSASTSMNFCNTGSAYNQRRKAIKPKEANPTAKLQQGPF